MATTVNMVTRLQMPKDSEKFHPYTTFESNGWSMPRLRINANERDYSHTLEISALYKADGTGTVRAFTPSTYDDSGNRTSGGESVDIKWKDRLDPKKIAGIATSSKYIIDLEEPDIRKARRKLVDKIKNKEQFTEDELKLLGVTDEAGAKTRLVESQKKHHEYISSYDFMLAVKNVLEKGEYKNRLFHIPKCKVNESYYQKKNTFYESIEPQWIYLADADAKEEATLSCDFYFGKDAVDVTADGDKLIISGWIRAWVGKPFKEDKMIPKTITYVKNGDSEMEKKRFEYLKNKLFVNDKDTLKCIALDLDLIDGSPRVAITLKDLPDDIREQVELGFLTEEEAIRQNASGSYIRGDRVREQRFLNSKKQAEDSVYTMKDTELFSDTDSNEGLFDSTTDEVKEEQKTETKVDQKVEEAAKDSSDEFDSLFG